MTTTIPHYNVRDLEKQAQMLLKEGVLKSQNLEQRIAYFSKRFLSRPYVNGALGEGCEGRYDQNPLFRFDAFDCLTYVNTVLALSLAKSVGDFKQQLMRLNYYDGQPDYLKRFHFMSLDWNRQNQRARFIQDITNTIKNEHQDLIFQTASAPINKGAWFKKKSIQDLKLFSDHQVDASERLLQLHKESDAFSPEDVSIDYLPLTQLFASRDKFHACIREQIPNASIIQIVRPAWDLTQLIGTHLHVSHLGFCFHKDGALVFRHASSEAQHVVEISLEEYLFQRLDSPTIKGIAVFKCLNQAL